MKSLLPNTYVPADGHTYAHVTPLNAGGPQVLLRCPLDGRRPAEDRQRAHRPAQLHHGQHDRRAGIGGAQGGARDRVEARGRRVDSINRQVGEARPGAGRRNGNERCLRNQHDG